MQRKATRLVLLGAVITTFPGSGLATESRGFAGTTLANIYLHQYWDSQSCKPERHSSFNDVKAAVHRVTRPYDARRRLEYLTPALSTLGPNSDLTPLFKDNRFFEA